MPAGVQGAKILVTTLTNRRRRCPVPALRHRHLGHGAVPLRVTLRADRGHRGATREILRVPTMGGGRSSPLAGCARPPPPAGIPIPFAQLPGGLRILISIQPGCDGKTIRRAVERSIHQALVALDAAAPRGRANRRQHRARRHRRQGKVGRGRAGAVSVPATTAIVLARDRSAVPGLVRQPPPGPVDDVLAPSPTRGAVMSSWLTQPARNRTIVGRTCFICVSASVWPARRRYAPAR